MENKQTALRDLLDQIIEIEDSLKGSEAIYAVTAIKVKALVLLKRDRKQIIDAHAHGDENHTFNSSKIEEYANDYYEETYRS